MLEGIIGSKEAAEITGYSEKYIKNLCANNHIPCKKIGRAWVIDRYTDEFLNLVEKRKLSEVK